MAELKNLQALGLSTLGHALRAAFDLLNLNRLVSGIDNYGQVWWTLTSPCAATQSCRKKGVKSCLFHPELG